MPWAPPRLSRFCSQNGAIHDPQHTIRQYLADHFCHVAQKCSCLCPPRQGYVQADQILCRGRIYASPTAALRHNKPDP
jgi:hypothetical protein